MYSNVSVVPDGCNTWYCCTVSDGNTAFSAAVIRYGFFRSLVTVYVTLEILVFPPKPVPPFKQYNASSYV